MVERTAASEAPSSPQPPEAGARKARLYGALSGAENRNRQTMPSRLPTVERDISIGEAGDVSIGDLQRKVG